MFNYIIVSVLLSISQTQRVSAGSMPNTQDHPPPGWEYDVENWAETCEYYTQSVWYQVPRKQNYLWLMMEHASSMGQCRTSGELFDHPISC